VRVYAHFDGYGIELRERTGSVAARVLRDLGLSPVGREIGKAMKAVSGRDNRAASIELMHRRVNEYLGIPSGKRGAETELLYYSYTTPGEAQEVANGIDRMISDRDSVHRVLIGA
jgi:hypothetical protein